MMSATLSLLACRSWSTAVAMSPVAVFAQGAERVDRIDHVQESALVEVIETLLRTLIGVTSQIRENANTTKESVRQAGDERARQHVGKPKNLTR
jgi:hypothetical protein